MFAFFALNFAPKFTLPAVEVFLGSTVGMLMLHMAIIAVYLITNHTTGKRFLIAFLVGFVVSFIFEIISLVRHVENERKRR